jgi:dihydrofolate reductase
MGKLTSHITISLDGYTSGPNPTFEDPIGEGGRLHRWMVDTFSWQQEHGGEGGERNLDSELVAELLGAAGAQIMGRKMFGGGDGAWDEEWIGWWGDEPPFHQPVFVLTHHERAPLVLGETTFTFVTGGIESALKQAQAAAGERDVAVAGGASAVRQYLAAGLLDELYLHIVPVLLGGGERLLDGVGDPTLEVASVIASPTVTHVKYRVVH